MIFISLLILIVAIALPSFQIKLSPILFTRLSSIIFIYAGALSFNALYIESIGSGLGIYSGLFHVTVTSQIMDTFLLLIASVILVAWPIINNSNLSVKNNTVNIKNNLPQHTVGKINPCTEYSLIIMFSTLGASLLISCADLVSMYLSIELQSFGVYILSTLYRDSESATSAGLKYFLLGGLSSCIILLGSGLLYSYTGLTNFESIYSLISVSYNNQIIQGLSLGLILILIGLLFKIAAAPLHNWAPDVYDDSPTIVTLWLTIMPKISILILLLELQNGISLSSEIELVESLKSINLLSDLYSENIVYVIKNLLLISSLLSLIIGTVVGLAQTKIKRLLAYSTISHIGFILLALAINSEQSTESLIFYIIQYSITNLNVFLIIIALGYLINNNKFINNNYYGSNTDIRFISELKGQFFLNPVLTISLTICLFSMAGVPPLIGFFSKQFVLFAAIQNGYYFMSIVAILVSVISASYYLKIIRVLHTEENINTPQITNINEINSKSSTISTSDSVLSNLHSYIISILTLSILLFVLKPSIILNSIQLLSLSLFYF
jgi:NADH-ubiquinone oxidoreductase chain 2